MNGFCNEMQRKMKAGYTRRLVHENLPYSTLYFFPTYWAFNIGWHERPECTIKSYAEPTGLFMPYDRIPIRRCVNPPI